VNSVHSRNAGNVNGRLNHACGHALGLWVGHAGIMSDALML
jgi:predicted Zn-dependent protease